MTATVTSKSERPPVLTVEGLRTEFESERGTIAAVDGVSFTLGRGEVLGIVGESGSGKSVTGYSIMGLIDPPGRIVAGSIRLFGDDILALGENERRALRGNRIAMVFQDPMAFLHPMLTIGRQMIDAIRAHRPISRRQARAEAADALEKVGVPSPRERLDAYPHQLSGGMRQRVAIAIALLNQPDVIIADEPTTGLDATIQAQILHEMQKLVAQTGTALIWITHDLAVVASLADRVAVMYAGSIVEQGAIDDVLYRPAHPYTAALLASVPSRSKGAKRLPQIPGSLGSAHFLSGCRFQPRCSLAQEECSARPVLREVSTGHQTACFLAEDRHFPPASRMVSDG